MNRLSILLTILLVAAAPVSCVATVIHFDEFGTSAPVDANGIHLEGVTFLFGPGSADFNGMIGTSGNTVFLTDPVLTGPTTGTLTLLFDFPTPILQFDIALLSAATIDNSSSGPNGGPAYIVTLSDGTVLNGGTSPQPAGFYSEGQFSYSGPAINSASITFFSGLDAQGASVNAFGLDNVAYISPEPGSIVLLTGGLFGLGLIRRWRA
jgi:hypothetical protein